MFIGATFRAIQHDDVTQLLCSTTASRAIGLAVSAWLVRDVLVDTAFPSVGDTLEHWVAVARPGGALVTHWHEDHAGNVARLAARGLPIGMAPETLVRVRSPRRIGLYRRISWGSAPPIAGPVDPFSHPALTLVPARGHSPDHHVVWDAERETMFGGDLFIGVKVRVAHLGEDPYEQARSLRAMAALRPRRFFDAHRGAVAHPVEQLLAKASWIEDTVRAIEDRVARGWSDGAIRNAVLGRYDPVGWFSAGDYSKLNVVRNVRRELLAGA